METTVLENPVIRADDLVSSSEEQELLELSQQADEGKIDPENIESKSTLADDVSKDGTEEVKPGDVEAEQPKTERARDEQGKFTKAQTDKAAADRSAQEIKSGADAKPETPYTKAQKEQKRRDDSWRALNEEKERIRAYEAQLMQKAQAMQQTAQAPAQQRPQYTSKDMADAYKDFETKADEALSQAKKALNEGDYDAHQKHLETVAKNRELAKQAATAAGKLYTVENQYQQQEQAGQFQNYWTGRMTQLMNEDPVLADTNSQLSKQVALLLKQEPVFGIIADGFPKAAGIAKMQIENAEVHELKKELVKVKADNDRLRGLTSIRGSGPTSPQGKKDLDSMSVDEQMKHLERLTEEADYGT